MIDSTIFSCFFFFCFFCFSSGAGDAVRGRHERRDGAQSDGAMALFAHRQQVPTGGQNGVEITTRFRRIRRDQLPAVRQSRPDR